MGVDVVRWLGYYVNGERIFYFIGVSRKGYNIIGIRENYFIEIVIDSGDSCVMGIFRVVLGY